MNVQDIVALARAGFTAEQITGFFQADQPQPAAQAAQPDPQPQPAAQAAQPDPQPQPAAQAAQPDPQPQPAAQPDPYATLMAELQGIRAQIQQTNRSYAQQPQPQPAPQAELTGVDVLAKIIAPPRQGSTN